MTTESYAAELKDLVDLAKKAGEQYGPIGTLISTLHISAIAMLNAIDQDRLDLLAEVVANTRTVVDRITEMVTDATAKLGGSA